MAVAARAYTRRDVALLVACLVLSLVAQGLPERLRAPISAALRRSIVAPLVVLQRDAERSRDAFVTRNAQAIQRDSVVMRSLALERVQSENDRLRRLLGLGAQLRWGFVPAEVIRGSGQSEDQTVILSAGSRAGVQPFSPVVAPEGIVGMVRTVDPGMSIAILWTHPDFRVSAMAADGSAFGIVGAHLGSGPERYLLEMRGVPIRSTLKPGTQIVSSGLGGVFPRGIPLGTILGEIKTTEGWAHTYLLRPTVVPAALGAVMVLLPPRAAAKVDNVWANGVGTEEATRTAVAAGDSLTRAAAQAQAAVQAARDSALRVMASRDSLKQLVVDSTARVRRDTATTRRVIVGYDSTGAPVYRTVRRDTAAMRRRRDSVGVAPPPNVFQIPARPPRRDSARGRPDSTRRP